MNFTTVTYSLQLSNFQSSTRLRVINVLTAAGQWTCMTLPRRAIWQREPSFFFFFLSYNCVFPSSPIQHVATRSSKCWSRNVTSRLISGSCKNNNIQAVSCFIFIISPPLLPLLLSRKQFRAEKERNRDTKGGFHKIASPRGVKLPLRPLSRPLCSALCPPQAATRTTLTTWTGTSRPTLRRRRPSACGPPSSTISCGQWNPTLPSTTIQMPRT